MNLARCLPVILTLGLLPPGSALAGATNAAMHMICADAIAATDPARQLALLEKANTLQPGSFAILYNLGTYYFNQAAAVEMGSEAQLEALRKAKPWFEAANKAQPGDPQVESALKTIEYTLME